MTESRPGRLSDPDVAQALSALTDWDGDAQGITRVVQFTSFSGAIDGVRAVAAVAEAADHHPDIDIRWRTVTFRLVTHSQGGVTEADIAMARQIDDALKY